MRNPDKFGQFEYSNDSRPVRQMYTITFLLHLFSHWHMFDDIDLPVIP